MLIKLKYTSSSVKMVYPPFMDTSLLSQIIASTIESILNLQVGVGTSFSTIIIPVLLSGDDWRGLKMNEEEASWFASLLFIAQSLGCIASIFIFVLFDRKYSMMMLNLPYPVCWLMLYFATDVFELYAASIIMGFTMGLIGTPISAYAMEISEPIYRSSLISYTNIFLYLGILYTYVLGSLVEWRTVCLVNLLLPVLSSLTLCLVPETPIWLLSQGRDDEAERALRWLRGWTTSEAVAVELAELKKYRDDVADDLGLTISCDPKVRNGTLLCERANQCCKDLFHRPSVLRPLSFVCLWSIVIEWTGVVATLPYLEVVGKELQFPIDPATCTIIFAVIAILGAGLYSLTIVKLKKGPIALCSFCLVAISNYILAALPLGMGSGWPAFLAFNALVFGYYYGVSSILWAYFDEIVPFRVRSQAIGIISAFINFGIFFSSKTFPHLRDLTGIRYVFIIYGTMSIIAFFIKYFISSRTEVPQEDEKNILKSTMFRKRVRADIPDAPKD